MKTTLKKAISSLSDQWDSFYLYNEAGIQESIHSLKTSFPQIAFLYSVKCNANPNVLACIFSQGFGADAASADEVELARQAGLSASQIYYSVPGKSIHDIERTIEAAILIADSLDEIKRIQTVAERLGKTVPIGIRINPVFSFLGDVGSASKFGIDENQLIDFLRKNPYPNVNAFQIDTLKDEAPSEKVTLVGNLCTAADVVAKDVLMPHLECGDAVILTNAGSYAAVLSPMQFSSQEPPKELFLTKDGVMI